MSDLITLTGLTARGQHGGLRLDDLIEIAGLTDAQLAGAEMAEGAKECYGLAEWDLARDVLLIAFRDRGQYGGRGAFSSWLYAIAAHRWQRMKVERGPAAIPLTEEMRLIRAQVGRRQSVGGALEELGKLLDVTDVVRDRGRSVVATVEFLQHRLSEMGHKTPPVTPTLPGRSAEAYA